MSMPMLRLLPAVALVFTLAACTVPLTQRDATTAANLTDTLTRGQIADILASPDRSAADRVNDVRRQPSTMLEFIGIRPGMKVLDLSAGGGYTTELLARAVGPGGLVVGQSAPPKTDSAPNVQVASEGAAFPVATDKVTATPAVRRTSLQQISERASLTRLTNIIPVVRAFETPVPAELENNQLDLVTLMFNYHDLGHLGVDRAAMNNAVLKALKPGGMYVVADHAGRTGTGISEAGTLHRIEEAFLRHEIDMAGFMFVAEGNFLRNPADPRDRNTPEPPQPKDDFVLKFIKPSMEKQR